MNKVEIGLRLRQFIEQNFSSITEFATKMDVHPSSFQSTYLKGRSIPGGELLAKLAILGCDLDWLLTGRQKNKPASTIREFPLVSMVGAGSIIPYDDQPPIMIPFPFSGEGLVLRVVGDSMASLISEGDLVLVDLIKRPKQGNIVAARTTGGEQFVKYLGTQHEDLVMFYSHNSYYSPIAFKKKEIITIKKVVYILKDVDYPE